MKLHSKIYRNILRILVVFTILFASNIIVNAYSEERVLPDDPLYKIDIILEKLNLFLTLNPNEKVERALLYANERIKEANAMLTIGKLDKVEEVLIVNSELVLILNNNIKKIKADNAENELIETLKIGNSIEEYRFNLDGLKNEIETSGEKPWAEEMSRLVEIDREEIKASIENKKLKAIIKVKAINEFNQSEAGRYLEELEKRYGLGNEEKSRVIRSLSRTKEYIRKARERLEIAHDRGFNTDDLAGRLDKMEKEIDNITISDDSYEKIKEIARKANDITVEIIAEKDGRKFEKEFLEKADKVLAEIKVIKKEI